MKYLEEELKTLAESDMYPFHMPGHKRNMKLQVNPYAYDITEIDDFDNLHEAEGIIAQAQQRAAELFHAEKSFFLVNGSTCGILAAISAAVPKGGKILMARNCHKAAYHAAYLRGLQISYVYPVITQFGIQGSIRVEDIAAALQEDASIQAVVITSPTYDGILSDIASIAELAHSYNIPLIVDEAHGAHLGFHSYFPQAAIQLGADVVIQSLHKTLPSFTQTAILHMNKGLVRQEDIIRFLSIYETSSPSYLFLAGMDHCVQFLTEQGTEYFKKYEKLLMTFYRKTRDYHYVQVLQGEELPREEAFQTDPSKLVISAVRAGLSGQELYNLLRTRYHLQMEMCQGGYVLAMTSIMDEEEGFIRLYKALSEIDHMAQKRGLMPESPVEWTLHDFAKEAYHRQQAKLSLSDALESEVEQQELNDCVGRIAGDFVNLYPPGIPMLVPGELITAQTVQVIKNCRALHLHIQGINEKNQIKVVIS